MVSAQFLRYLLVGVVNTAVGYGCIVLLRYGLQWHDLAANAAGYVAGACTSYLLNRSFTFKSERKHSHAVPWFVMAVLLCYAFNGLILVAALRWLHLPSYASQAMAMVAYNIAFFLVSRSFVFSHSPKA